MYNIIYYISCRLTKTWWDCVKDDVESLGLTREYAKFRNMRSRQINGKLANTGSPAKMATKIVCLYADLNEAF